MGNFRVIRLNCHDNRLFRRRTTISEYTCSWLFLGIFPNQSYSSFAYTCRRVHRNRRHNRCRSRTSTISEYICRFYKKILCLDRTGVCTFPDLRRSRPCSLRLRHISNCSKCICRSSGISFRVLDILCRNSVRLIYHHSHRCRRKLSQKVYSCHFCTGRTQLYTVEVDKWQVHRIRQHNLFRRHIWKQIFTVSRKIN